MKKQQLEKTIKQWLAVLITIVIYYLVHEGTHLLLALGMGVFERVRFVGLLGIQIVTNNDLLNGVNLALFSGLSSVITILIGYILAFSSSIYRIKNKNLLIGIYYITLCFLILDPLYLSVLSEFVGGGDLNGMVVGLGVSALPFKTVFGVILVINVLIFKNKVRPKYKEIFKEI